jgi:hypothetical protein
LEIQVTSEAGPNGRQVWPTIAGFFVFFFGLCTIFVGAVAAVQAWEEHAQAQWPEATAHVDMCEMDQTSTGERNMYYIDCRLTYVAGSEQRTTRFNSRNVPSRDVWQYPPNQIAPFEEWINDHPQGTPILVRYDPANHGKAVLAKADLPLGGPHTPGNLKLLSVAAASFFVMLTIARILR